MAAAEPHRNLEALLDQIERAGTESDPDPVALEAVLSGIGRRSFGPLLLVAGLITLAPIVGDIPGVPTIMAVFTVLIAGQLLFRRNHFWLPGWMLRRKVSNEKLRRILRWLRRPARFVDKGLRSRLHRFCRGPAVAVIAVVCIGIALAMPVMEFIPFSANGAGLALSAFGLALTAHDGLLALVAFAVTAGTAVLIGAQFVG